MLLVEAAENLVAKAWMDAILKLEGYSLGMGNVRLCRVIEKED